MNLAGFSVLFLIIRSTYYFKTTAPVTITVLDALLSKETGFLPNLLAATRLFVKNPVSDPPSPKLLVGWGLVFEMVDFGQLWLVNSPLRFFAEPALKDLKKSPIWGDFIQRYYTALISGIKHLSESQPAGPESIISPMS